LDITLPYNLVETGLIPERGIVQSLRTTPLPSTINWPFYLSVHGEGLRLEAVDLLRGGEETYKKASNLIIDHRHEGNSSFQRIGKRLDGFDKAFDTNKRFFQRREGSKQVSCPGSRNRNQKQVNQAEGGKIAPLSILGEGAQPSDKQYRNERPYTWPCISRRTRGIKETKRMLLLRK